jgi:hypothetical protein
MNKIRDLKEYDCPLLDCEIDMTICYDIQMVKDGFINERILDDYEFPVKLNRVKANVLCLACPYNQLVDTAETKVAMTK